MPTSTNGAVWSPLSVDANLASCSRNAARGSPDGNWGPRRRLARARASCSTPVRSYEAVSVLQDGYLRMLTARAMTRATVTRDTADCSIMAIFAQRDSGITSVGLKAVALVNDR